MADLLRVITSPDPAVRNQSLDELCGELSLEELLRQCAELDAFRRTRENLYERVRALFFLYALHRFHLPLRLLGLSGGRTSTTAQSRDETFLPPKSETS